MTLQHPTDRAHSRNAATRAAYSEDARKQLIVARSKLDGIAIAVTQAITVGRMKSSPQLDLAVNAMEANFKAAETQLRALQKSGEDDWDALRIQLESAWENLAHSIKNLVARFADASTVQFSRTIDNG